MIKFLVKRLFLSIVTILIIATITFLLMNMIPGGPFQSEKALSPEALQAMNQKYGLDKPLPVQLKNYLVKAIRGDFGVSLKLQRNRNVTAIIMEKFPVSAKIGVIALLIAIILGIPLGCLAAYNKGKWPDFILQVFTTIGITMPGFVVATLLLLVFGVQLRCLPTLGLLSWKGYVMPCFALSFYPMCYISRLMRSSMQDVLKQDYIRTAIAKGLPTWKVIFKHALRNSVLPVVTYLGPLVAQVLTGGFVVESVFSIPGLGKYFITSLLSHDYPIIMGTTIFLASFVILMNLVVDILYRVIDPRIKLTGGTSK